MADLKDLRKEIDEIDSQLVPLFARRMEAARKVAHAKMENNLAVRDEAREDQVVRNALALVPPEVGGEMQLLMRTLLALSREYQDRLMFGGQAAPLLPAPAAPVTDNVVCAYQGVPGAWSEQAAAFLFPAAKREMQDQFEDVFLAVKEGRAHYGVVPIENSKTGAIGETYDLLRKYGCFIVGRTWITVRQCLLGQPGATLADVREVYSHPEGFRQCRGFLKDRGWELTACRNTAVAAQRAADAADPKKAAIGSRLAGQLYGLDVLAADIMDAADNRTSFVVIALQPQYDATSDLVSVTFSTQHHSGALCEALLPFMAEDLNLNRIESRPAMAGQYRFFAEVEGNIDDERVQAALRQAAAASEYFEVLGCYRCTLPPEGPA